LRFLHQLFLFEETFREIEKKKKEKSEKENLEVIQLIDHNKTDMDNLLHPVTKEMSVNIVFVKKKKNTSPGGRKYK